MKLTHCGADFTLAREIQTAPPFAYLLMDGARFENIHAFIYQQDENPEYFPLYRNTYYRSIMEVSPCLVQVTHKNNGLASWFDLKGANELKAIAFFSDMPIDGLGHHFQQFLEVKLPTLEVVLFRFYDPEVFDCLARLDNSSQIAAIMQPCSAAFWKKDGVLNALRNNS